jgi:hypothetical protein
MNVLSSKLAHDYMLKTHSTGTWSLGPTAIFGTNKQRKQVRLPRTGSHPTILATSTPLLSPSRGGETANLLQACNEYCSIAMPRLIDHTIF